MSSSLTLAARRRSLPRPRQDVLVDWSSFPEPGRDFDRRLEEWRRRTGCTWRQIAEVLHTGSMRTIARWERGEATPSKEYEAKIQKLIAGGPRAVQGTPEDSSLAEAAGGPAGTTSQGGRETMIVA